MALKHGPHFQKSHGATPAWRIPSTDIELNSTAAARFGNVGHGAADGVKVTPGEDDIHSNSFYATQKEINGSLACSTRLNASHSATCEAFPVNRHPQSCPNVRCKLYGSFFYRQNAVVTYALCSVYGEKPNVSL